MHAKNLFVSFTDFSLTVRGQLLISWSLFAAVVAVMYALPKEWGVLFAKGWLFTLALGVLGMFWVYRTVVQHLESETRRAWLINTPVAVLLAVLVCLPMVSHAADCAQAKSFNDPCFAAGYQPGKPALTTPANVGKKFGKTDLKVIGKSVDGKYDVYNIENPGIDSYVAGNTMFRDRDIVKYLPEVDKADVGKTVTCNSDDDGLVCRDKKKQIVGLAPGATQFFKAPAKKH